MKRSIKIFLVCTAIFVTGAVSGSLLTWQYCAQKRGARRPPNTSNFGPLQMQRLTERLQLDEVQQIHIEPILDKAGQDLRKLRRESYHSSTAILATMEGQIAKLLTPEQQKQFAIMQAEQRERFQEHMREMQKRRQEADKPAPPPPPPPPPPAPADAP